MAEKPVEQYYTPPPKVGKWEGFRTFLWNSETSQFFGRTGSSWAKILLFYVIFYATLCGFFFAMLAVFYQTIDPRIPKWQLDKSLIGNNPGLGFRPMPPEENVESTLIWYKGSNEEDFKYWTKELDKFLEVYKATEHSDKRQRCNYTSGPEEGKVCDVNIADFSNCSSIHHYNYHRSAPCIFLKLNKIFNWVPEYYTDVKDLPQNMPIHLQRHIGNLKSNGSKEVADFYEEGLRKIATCYNKYGNYVEKLLKIETVWVSCEGENPADIENIGPIQYFPSRGYPGYYFPFANNEGYLSPLVAVWFENPATGVLINIECKAWAKNIFHDRAERRGSVHFELMID